MLALIKLAYLVFQRNSVKGDIQPCTLCKFSVLVSLVNRGGQSTHLHYLSKSIDAPGQILLQPMREWFSQPAFTLSPGVLAFKYSK